jgi:hypothetical protein
MRRAHSIESALFAFFGQPCQKSEFEAILTLDSPQLFSRLKSQTCIGGDTGDIGDKGDEGGEMFHP